MSGHLFVSRPSSILVLLLLEDGPKDEKSDYAESAIDIEDQVVAGGIISKNDTLQDDDQDGHEADIGEQNTVEGTSLARSVDLLQNVGHESHMTTLAEELEGNPKSVGNVIFIDAVNWHCKVINDLNDQEERVHIFVVDLVSGKRPKESQSVEDGTECAHESKIRFTIKSVNDTILLEVVQGEETG